MDGVSIHRLRLPQYQPFLEKGHCVLRSLIPPPLFYKCVNVQENIHEETWRKKKKKKKKINKPSAIMYNL